MPLYSYKAKDMKGTVKTGSLSAKSSSEAKNVIAQKKLKLLTLKETKDGSSKSNEQGEITPIFGNYIYKNSQGDIKIELSPKNPTPKDIIVFTKQLATMINSGVPLIQGLGILGKQQTSRIFGSAILKIQSSVENGGSFSSSLALYPEIFDTLFVAMIEAGEASGSLDTILLRLVTYIEKSNKIRNQIKSAMSYPVIIFIVAISVVSGLLIFVVPTFAAQYSDSGKALPGLTQFVIDMSNALGNHWQEIIGFIVALGVGFKFWVRTPNGKKQFDKYLLQAPGIGMLLKKVAVGRFCSTMASMLNSGVNLLNALTICASAAGNLAIEEFILGVRASLEQGSNFSDPLAEGGLFPDMVVSMVSVGEATGSLDSMLQKVSDFYEEEVDLAVQNLLAMIEPIMIVVIGGIVGFIVVAMYLPIFDMAGTAG
jgi:type IV pilus assembly protein PilC